MVIDSPPPDIITDQIIEIDKRLDIIEDAVFPLGIDLRKIKPETIRKIFRPLTDGTDDIGKVADSIDREANIYCVNFREDANRLRSFSFRLRAIAERTKQ